jgi:hypothetical protein
MHLTREADEFFSPPTTERCERGRRGGVWGSTNMVVGVYVDPRHNRCVRVIVQTRADAYTIRGVYGYDDETTILEGKEYEPEPSALTHRYWQASVIRTGFTPDGEDVLRVDFRSKAGKQRLVYRAVYNGRKREIQWDDGNVWHQLYFHPGQFRGLCPVG